MPSPKTVVVRLSVTRPVTTAYLAEMSLDEVAVLQQKLDSENAADRYRSVRRDHRFDLRHPIVTFMRLPTQMALKVLRGNTRDARSFRSRKSEPAL